MGSLNPASDLVPSKLIAPGVASATPNTIPTSTQNPGTDYYRLYNPANRVGNGQYAGPVATPDNTNIGAANAGFNQVMMEISQHFEPMIQISVLNQPRWWHDRIPRAAYTLFNGTVHETRIFRGALMKYAGLDEWQDIDPYPTTTNDPCAALGYNTPTYGWEALSWRGKRSAWGSDPICADQFKFFDQAQQQLAWILATGAEYGIQMQEVWNRDMFVYQSVSFKRSFIMSSEYTGKATEGRYYYNPFIKFDGTGNGSEGHALSTVTGGKPFILVDASVEVEPLNFDMLDKVRASLQIRCPNAAVSRVGGEPIFALAVSHDDVEKYVRGNEEERKYWIEANPQALIKHYDFATAVFRRWMITNDNNQLRFKRTKLIKSFSATDALNYGLDAQGTELFVGKDVWVAVSVDPLVASENRPGINGTIIPEDNPEYLDAELAIAPVFMNQIFTNQFVPSISSLGSGTSFGPTPGLNGTWTWLNIRDRATNPLGNKGNFYGMFEIVPKPDSNVFHAISFLYRRCTVALKSFCPQDNTKINPQLADSAKLVADVDVGTKTAVTLYLDKMLKVQPGDTFKVTKTTGTPSAWTWAFYNSTTGAAVTDEHTCAWNTDSDSKWILDDGETGEEKVAGTGDELEITFATAGIKAVRTASTYTTATAQVDVTVFRTPTALSLDVQLTAQTVPAGGYVKFAKDQTVPYTAS